MRRTQGGVAEQHPGHAGPRHASRRRGVGAGLERLEPRLLLAGLGLDPSALITLGGSVDSPRAADVVPVLLTRDRLTPATASQHTLINFVVEPAAGSRFNPGACQLVDSTGHPLHVRFTRSGDVLTGLARVAPGDYGVRVRGRSGSTGAFVVQAILAGDVNGSGSVDASDLALIRGSLHRPGSQRLGSGSSLRLGRAELSVARRNQGAVTQTVSIQVANLTGTSPGNQNPEFSNSQIYVSIYGMVPGNDSPTNPDGWSYFDATGTPHSLSGLSTVPSFTLAQAPQGIPVPLSQVVNSGEVYVGLGSPVVLPVNNVVAGFRVTKPGSKYATPPTVSISGGAVAAATLGGGTVTATQITSPGSGYVTAPQVQFIGGGGSGATGTATVAGGKVTAITITQNGTGYSSAPTVALTGGGGQGAGALAVITAGVSSVNVVQGGSGFTTAPGVILAGGGGTGATATASISQGNVISIQVTNPGTGYTAPPAVIFSTGANATATAQIAGRRVSNVIVGKRGVGYTTPPNITFSGGGGSGAAATAQIEVLGVAAPSPSNSADPNQDVYWDFAEFTMNYPNPTPNSINADLSQVDVVSFPMTLQLTSTSGPSSPVVGVYSARNALLQGFDSYLTSNGQTLFPSLYANSGAGNEGPFRILAPSDYVLLKPQDPLASYYHTALGQFFSLGRTISVVVPEVMKPVQATATATLNAKGGIAAIQLTSPGSGYTFPPVITLQGGGGAGAVLRPYINAQGQVQGVLVLNPGHGFTTAPQVSFSNGSGIFKGVVHQSTASGQAVLSGQTVSAVNVTNPGLGYTQAPTVRLVDGGGTGATAVAQINSSGQVTQIVVTNPGAGYTTPPVLDFTPAPVIDEFTAPYITQQGMLYKVYSPFTPPSWVAAGKAPTWMVFGNSGVFADNASQFPDTSSAPSQVLGKIEDAIVAALSRGVGLDPYSTWANGPYYTSGSTANWYAGYLHQNTVTVGGLAYAFAFDDQGNNSTDVSLTNPKAMIINVGWKQALPTS